MTITLTRYTFRVAKSGGELDIETGRQLCDTIIGRCDSDAQAELQARRISDDRNGAWVKISRADASWSVQA